ncbi:MAG: hypothetical protein JNL82_17390 [Myxococcales bacterium]|nr:hypothetical protein [Myxococcales bacterium]
MSRRTRRGCSSPKPWPVGEVPPKPPVLAVRRDAAIDDRGVESGAAIEDRGVESVEATVETINRRHYFRGATFELGVCLWEMGADWDPEQKARWVGGKREEAEATLLQALERLRAQRDKKADAGVDLTANVIVGRAKYRGRVYCVLVAPRRSKKGALVCQLAFRDGSRMFWLTGKKASEVEMLREYREPRSINSLRAFAEQARRQPVGMRYECVECGEWATSGEGECLTTGSAH